ncbi:MAG TPA: hypothetical protein VLT58_05015, partial [Polyangia bacterium]|nr:hypothetical protein [Polyangia bacterium]
MTPESTVDVLVADRDPARRRARERRRSLGRAIRRTLLALVLLGVTAAVLLALRPRAVPVDVMRTRRGPLVVAVEESGRTRVKDRYVVSAPAAGSLSRVTLDAGDTVQEGDVLAEIAPALAPLLAEAPGLRLRLLVDDQMIDLIDSRIDIALRVG